MKKVFYILLIAHCSLLIDECYSQWYELTSGTTNLLFDICFPDVNTGYAAGLFGSIYKTTNGGTNWVSQATPTSSHLYNIFFPNVNTGYAVGESAALIKTTNGGINWNVLAIPVFENLTGAYFNDADNGYLSAWGGKIFKTTNGGTNWIVLQTNVTVNLNKIHFSNNQTGYACGTGGTLIKTTDGGANWTQQNSGIAQNIFGIFAAGNDTVYASADEGKIIKTTNGGSSWFQQNSQVPDRLNDVFFLNASTGTIAGSVSVILRTTNGGSSWVRQQAGVPAGQDFLGVWFNNILTGFSSGTNGKIIKTITGGFPYPSQPVLVSPPNGATGVVLTPLLNWDSVTTAETYKLQLATDSSFSGLVIDTAQIVNSHLQVQPGRLNNNTLYFWRVRGTNIVGDGPHSSIFRFRTVVAFPLPPNLLLPLNGASNVPLTPTFDWDSNSVANYYNLQASLDTSFSNPSVNVTGITVSNYTVTTPPLQYNSRYYWRVNTVNDAGTSPWSAVRNFTTILGPPAPPTLLAPPNGTIGVNLTPTMRWVEDISATSYQLQISLDSTFVSPPQIDTTVTDSSQCTIRGGVLVNVQTYFWRVRTTNPIGQSPWSAVWKFITLLSPPGPPQLIFPPNDTTGISLTPTLNWNDVQYAQTYRVQLATDSLFTIGSTLVNVSGLPASQYTVSGGLLSNNTVYYWRVRASNAAGDGQYSAVWKFRTIISPPVAPPSLLSPPNGSFNQTLTPTLDWNDVFGTQGYQLLVTSDSLFNTINIDTTISPSQFTVPAGLLLPTTTYYWKVRGFNTGGFGPFSVTWRFTTGLIGISQISNEIPNEFKLYNNYPNPFNPQTNIKFDLPVSVYVSLKVYDILGREDALLVSEKLSAGYYEVSWDASDLPSGVYFYRIVAGEYADVKKMVVLK